MHDHGKIYFRHGYMSQRTVRATINYSLFSDLLIKNIVEL